MRGSLGLMTAALLTAACGAPADHGQRLPGAEDSLFLGYWLGMPRDSFYHHSWALNRQGLIMQGPRNEHIQYEMDSTFAHEATMLFYPDFHDDRIARMRVRFSYDAWAPWNRWLHADSLLPAVLQRMVDLYGEGFQARRAPGPHGQPTLQYVLVGQRRRITVGVLSDIEVGVLFTDLEAERKVAAARDAEE